jgi:cytochrome c oxidase subunit 3
MSDHAPSARPRLAVQFENLGVQEHAARLGMWIFLGSELLLFAGLFGLYVAYRTAYSAEFSQAVHHNSIAIGTVNTAVLLISSFSAAFALHSVRRDNRRTALRMLLATMLLGSVFLANKAVEYTAHFHEGIYPGQRYSFEELPGPGGQLFFTLYYLMTGLHALHMIGGIAVIAWLTRRVARRTITREHHAALEMGALYWHLVDSIWIFLWPLFYLTG